MILEHVRFAVVLAVVLLPCYELAGQVGLGTAKPLVVVAARHRPLEQNLEAVE